MPFTQGAFSEITGPVMPELIAQTHSGYEAIAQAISMRGAGHALGGIVGMCIGLLPKGHNIKQTKY